MAKSASFFEFTSDTYLIGHDGEILVDMHYNLAGIEATAFRIRPVASSGVSYIYDSSKEVWVPSNAPWVSMPYLQEVVQVKVGANSRVNMFFEIQNVYSSEIYTTNPRVYYPYSEFYTSYKNLRLIGETVGVQKSSFFGKVLKYMNGIFQKT